VVGLILTVSSITMEDIHLIERQDTSFVEDWYVSNGKNTEKIQIEVKKEPYTNQEKIELLEQAVEELEADILGENQSLDKVEYPLQLIKTFDESGIVIDWDTSDPLVLDWDGQIGEDVPEEGIKVQLQAELVLEEYRRIFAKEVTVFPMKLTEEERFITEIKEELKKKNEQQGQYLHLPLSLNGEKLTWERADRFAGIMWTLFTTVIGVLLVLSENSRRKAATKKRLNEMENDYPGILSKMLLFMQAGVSSRRALQKISMDYKKDLEKGKPQRAAYEELLKMHREMEQGISEEMVYRNLGNRSDLLCYRTFSTLLIQNLKKGSSYFLSALKQECSNAFAERKSRALILGEKIGTKLLIPMGVMLLIVLLIILVPSMMALG
jgi:hypothetical protein